MHSISAALKNQVELVETTLSRIDTIAKTLLPPAAPGEKVSQIIWLRNKAKVEKIHDHLRNLRFPIVVILTCLNAFVSLFTSKLLRRC